MSVPIERVMRSNSDGTEEQVFPQTHVDAILGLPEAVKGYDIQIGVRSINGQTGNVFLNILSDEEYNAILELIKRDPDGKMAEDIKKNKNDISELKIELENLKEIVNELNSKTK